MLRIGYAPGLRRAKSALAATQGPFPPVSPAGRPVAAPERTNEREAPGTYKQVRSATGLTAKGARGQDVARHMQQQLGGYGITGGQVPCR